MSDIVIKKPPADELMNRMKHGALVLTLGDGEPDSYLKKSLEEMRDNPSDECWGLREEAYLFPRNVAADIVFKLDQVAKEQKFPTRYAMESIW